MLVFSGVGVVCVQGEVGLGAGGSVSLCFFSSSSTAVLTGVQLCELLSLSRHLIF